MQRPGPLLDWPLLRFVSEANIPSADEPSHPRLGKRPLSPGGSLSSSSKRRVVVDQPIALRRMGRLSSLPSHLSNHNPKTLVQRSRLRSVHVVASRSHESWEAEHGHRSDATASTRSRCTSAPACPSPPRTSSSFRDVRRSSLSNTPMEMDEDEASASNSLTPPHTSTYGPLNEYKLDYSEAYPGFDIYRDPIDAIEDLLPVLDEIACAAYDPLSEEEEDKENIPPPRMEVTAARSACSPWAKAGLLSPRKLYGEDDPARTSIPITPLARKFHDATLTQSPVTPRARKTSPSNTLDSPSLGSPLSIRSVDKLELMERKKLLADEVDDMDWDEEDE